MSNKENIPFQHLIFLIRDWQNKAERVFGWIGGQEYLSKNVLEIRPNHDKASQELREYLCGKSFHKINCFLMPHPGLNVSECDFDGKLASIREDFKEQLKLLVPEILHPEKLTLKGLYLKPMKSSDLYASIHSFINLFKSDKLPEPKSLYETIMIDQLKSLLEKCLRLYLDEINKTQSEIQNQAGIELLDQTAKSKAIQYYSDEPKMGSEEIQNEYKNLLIAKINLEYEKWKIGIMERLEKEEAQRKAKQLEKEKRCFNCGCFPKFGCFKNPLKNPRRFATGVAGTATAGAIGTGALIALL